METTAQQDKESKYSTFSWCILHLYFLIYCCITSHAINKHFAYNNQFGQDSVRTAHVCSIGVALLGLVDLLLRWRAHSVPIHGIPYSMATRCQEPEADAASLLRPSPETGSESFLLYPIGFTVSSDFYLHISTQHAYAVISWFFSFRDYLLTSYSEKWGFNSSSSSIFWPHFFPIISCFHLLNFF